MIEKMRFISITGPKNDFDRVVNTYLTKYDIHLENALTELSTSYNLRPFADINPYRELITKSEDLVKKLEQPQLSSEQLMEPEAAADIINSAYAMLSDINVKKHEIKNHRHELNDLLIQIEHFRHLDYNIHQIINLKFIKYRFGKVPHEFYTRFSKFVYDNLNTVFYECERDRDYVWGIYFVPANEAIKIDAIYASLHFERVKIPDAYEGTPEESYYSIREKITEINNELNDIYKDIHNRLNNISEQLELAHHSVCVLSKNFEVRKMAACTRDKGKNEVFYIICGWISDEDSEKLLKEAETDSLAYCVIDDGQVDADKKPPTKLKNLKIFKPFEMFIKMYGLPAYNEIDPTSFVAITYSIIFGIMFGDVGQGLCLVIGGALLYKIKNMNLAAIISLAGVFSTIFGFMYGSVFGFENWIDAIWLSPRENVMTVLITAVGFGVFLILLAMILNIVNGIKAKDWGRVLFDTNGVAGLLFYAVLIISIAFIFTGRALPGFILMGIFFGLPLMLIFFKEPLTHMIEKRTKIFPEHKALFFMETFFELFEVLLSYLTNTISFLRIGAFALSHAGMMAVVMLLAGEETGHPNLLILILGNLFVAGMEGLIVGIQVLRLEYYEMFSRFYKGNGKEFTSYKSKLKNKNI
ncbi:MAG: V-type ATPase kDa subunit [Herbinix sp.]|jgi:V/A-type H+-transporting ATPase subunit I|nr:V-type ATPase kDa subunit [Herbinix sp.]